MVRYWLAVDGQSHGPYSADEVRRHASAATPVSYEGGWVPLAQHPDFAPQRSYWLAVDGRTYGPYGAAEIRAYATPGALVSHQGGWVPLSRHPELASPVASPRPAPREGRGGRWLLATLAALIVVSGLVAGGWALWPRAQPPPPPSVVADPPVPTVTPPEERSAPGASPGWVSPPLDERPAPGLRLTAPAGALDRSRTFAARSLSVADLEEHRETLARHGFAALAGFELDAGMSPGDRYRGPVRLHVDLDAAGVPPEVRRWTALVTSGEGAGPTLMASRLEGTQLTCDTAHNGLVFIAIGLSTIVGLTQQGLVGPDRTEETEGKEWIGVLSQDGHFQVLWPKDVHAPDAEAIRRLQELERLWTDYAYGVAPPSPAPGVPSTYTSVDAWKKHLQARIASIEEVVRDRRWQLEHWAHPAAPLVGDALEYAYGHLTGERGFPPPGHVVNVYLRTPWKGGADVLGLATDPKTGPPYFSLDLEALARKDRGSSLPATVAAELEVTVLHELLHVLQSSYAVDWNSQLWFQEAAALALERQARPAYAGRVASEADWERALTSRDQFWGVFRGALEPAGIEDEAGLRHHGYGASFFLEHCRTALAPGGDENLFLSGFTDAAHAAGGGVPGLQSMASKRGADLAGLYLEFARANAANILQQPMGTSGEVWRATRGDPVREWSAMRQVPPLSSQIHRLVAPESEAGHGLVKVAFIAAGLDAGRVELRATTDYRKGWTTLGEGLVALDPVRMTGGAEPRGTGFWLQVIGAFTPTGSPVLSSVWRVLFLYPPAQPPVLPQGPSLGAEEAARAGALDVAWRPSTLAGRHELRGYRIRVRAEKDGNLLQDSHHDVDRSRTSTRLPLSSLIAADLLLGGQGRARLRVTQAEVIADHQGTTLVGPESPEAALELSLGQPARPSPAPPARVTPAPTRGASTLGRWVRLSVNLVPDYPDEKRETGSGGDGSAACQATFAPDRVARARFSWTPLPASLVPGTQHPVSVTAADGGSTGPFLPSGAVGLRCRSFCTLRVGTEVHLSPPGPPGSDAGTLSVDRGRKADDRLYIDVHSQCGLAGRLVTYSYAWEPN